MHPEFLGFGTLAIVLGGVMLLVVLFAWGKHRRRRQRREAMRRGNQIYYEWLRQAHEHPSDRS